MKFKSLGLHITDKCNMYCSHCITDASPNGLNVMSFEMIKSAIEDAVGYFTNICITGGEALLYPELVAKTLSYAHLKGFTSSLVSNCYWVKNETLYERILNLLNENSLSKLAISFDEFHEKRMFDVKELIKLLGEKRRKFAIVVQPCYLNSKDMAEHSDDIKKICEKYNCGFEPTTIVPFGRAERIIPQSNEVFLKNSPCDVVRLPLLKYNGEYSVCCGPTTGSPFFSPLVYEKFSKGTLNNVRQDVIINCLFMYGARFLYEKLTDELKEMVHKYSRHIDNACGLCRAMCDQREVVEYLYKVLEKDKWLILCSSELEGEL